MALSGSLPQINLGVQGETQGVLRSSAQRVNPEFREYSDNSRPRREFNTFEGQGFADNRRFDGRRRGGQSDHRFHNQGGSRNSAFRGQNDQNRYLNF
ncbi:hypothetical protein TNCV_4283611 [Trichonephila clavipes]|nr:hypothetical protein TNCV_4283611 [Trichonephila clavipes]